MDRHPNHFFQALGGPDLKILQWGPGIHPIPPPAYGAVERHIHGLSQSLIKRGHEVEVLNAPVGSEYKWFLQSRGRVLRTDADVVHVHTDFIGAMVPKQPAVYTSHNPCWIARRNGLAAAWGSRLARVAVRRSARTIALTQSIRSSMSRIKDESAIDVIPNAVDLEMYSPRMDARTGRRVAILGQVVPHKGVHIVAEALRDTEAELHVIGVQPDAKYVEVIRQVNPRVKFHKNLPDEQLSDLLGSMDVYAHASSAEALSIAVIEAMASGLPIVGTPMVAAQVDGNGRVLDDASPGHFRQAIMELLDDDALRRRQGTQSRNLAKQRYSWDAVARSVEATYERAREHA